MYEKGCPPYLDWFEPSLEEGYAEFCILDRTGLYAGQGVRKVVYMQREQ